MEEERTSQESQYKKDCFVFLRRMAKKTELNFMDHVKPKGTNEDSSCEFDIEGNFLGFDPVLKKRSELLRKKENSKEGFLWLLGLRKLLERTGSFKVEPKNSKKTSICDFVGFGHTTKNPSLLRIEHWIEGASTNLIKKDLPKQKSSLKRIFKCTKCNIRFTTLKSLSVHVLHHRKLICPFCKNHFNSKIYLYRHILGYHNEYKMYAKFRCTHCDRPKAHEKLRPYKSDHCNKALSNSRPQSEPSSTCPSQLADTLSSVNEKLNCEKSVSINDKLSRPNQIKTVHENIIVNQKKNSTRLIMTHKQPKSFKCDICKKIFHDKNYYDRHMRAIKCIFCTETFCQYKVLSRHISDKHILQKTFHCKSCDKIFVDIFYLKKHILKAHRPATPLFPESPTEHAPF